MKKMHSSSFFPDNLACVKREQYLMNSALIFFILIWSIIGGVPSLHTNLIIPRNSTYLFNWKKYLTVMGCKPVLSNLMFFTFTFEKLAIWLLKIVSNLVQRFILILN